MMISVSDIMGRTATATGVSRSTIYRVINEKKKECSTPGAKLSTPGKKRPNRTPTKSNIDTFAAAPIKRKIYTYSTSYIPRLIGMHKVFKLNKLIEGSVWTLRQMLKKLNFRYANNNCRREFLLERPDIVTKRLYFLHKMKQLRKSECPIEYLDET